MFITRKNFIPVLFYILLILCLFVVYGESDYEDQSLINMVRAHHQNYDNFKSQALLSLDIPNIRMPAKRIDIYYQKPGRVEVRSRGFAIVPRFTFFPIVFCDLDSLKINSIQERKLDTNLYFIYSNWF